MTSAPAEVPGPIRSVIAASRPSRERPLGRVVDRLFGAAGWAFVGTGAVREHQQVAHETVDLGGVDLPALDGVDELVAVDADRTRHLEAEPGVRCRRSVVDAVPVGHDEPVEAPLVSQDVGEEPSVLRSVLAGQFVVRTHDAPGVCLGHGAFERAQVQLAQRSLVDVDVDRHALDLGVVGHEVLDRHGHVVRLDATDVGARERTGQFRILAVALEGPSTDRCAVQIDGWSEHDVGALAHCFGADQRSDLTNEIRVPGGTEGDS